MYIPDESQTSWMSSMFLATHSVDDVLFWEQEKYFQTGA